MSWFLSRRARNGRVNRLKKVPVPFFPDPLWIERAVVNQAAECQSSSALSHSRARIDRQCAADVERVAGHKEGSGRNGQRLARVIPSHRAIQRDATAAGGIHGHRTCGDRQSIRGNGLSVGPNKIYYGGTGETVIHIGKSIRYVKSGIVNCIPEGPCPDGEVAANIHRAAAQIIVSRVHANRGHPEADIVVGDRARNYRNTREVGAKVKSGSRRGESSDGSHGVVAE